MEFKGATRDTTRRLRCYINRIKVEFKEKEMKEKNPEKTILIESKWNLKDEEDDDLDCETVILIESKWNLKVFRKIEKTAVAKDINRIKVEFKAESRLSVISFSSILIESKWNLKCISKSI